MYKYSGSDIEESWAKELLGEKNIISEIAKIVLEVQGNGKNGSEFRARKSRFCFRTIKEKAGRDGITIFPAIGMSNINEVILADP